MPEPKVIILTGASRGIGLAIAQFLLKASHKLVLIARTAGPLEELKTEYPGQVEILAADLADFSNAQKAIDLCLKAFSKIDALILNHGTLDPVKKIADTTPEEWKEAYDINFFSALAFTKAALPTLRLTHGRIISTSSGAATNAYATWGAYGSSKAALHHLMMTLTNEEPFITSISVKPGVVDTEMQTQVRTHAQTMAPQDVAKFHTLHETGQLLRPAQPGNVIARLSLNGGRELGGKMVSWNDPTLSAFQD